MSKTELLDKIKDLQRKSEGLEPSESDRDGIFKAFSDYTTRFYDEISETPAYTLDLSYTDQLSIDNKPHDLSRILKDYRELVERKGINPASGGHLGYIPGGGIFMSAVADLLADVTNEYAGVYFGSPGAVTIEYEVLNWLKNVFGFPKSSIGNLASGGSIANLIALTAARDKHKVKGVQVEKSVIYLTEHVHHCIQKALRIIGLEDAILRYVNIDFDGRMVLSDLERAIESDKKDGLSPFLVIGSAGTTDTGAVDPLNDIADIASEHGLWYHIDAAYGGFFILCESKKHLFKGIDRADSLVIDPHKGLFMPYGVGAVLVKDKEAVLHSHHYTANYMQDVQAPEQLLSPAEVSPELTKHFRGLRVWLPLQFHGLEPFVACLEEKILLTEYFRMRLKDLGFKLGPEPDLSVSYFWFPREHDEDEFNRNLMKKIHQDGSVFLSSSTINGRFVIRMAILAFRTKIETIDRAVEMIERCLKE